jgi:hypothetical protein
MHDEKLIELIHLDLDGQLDAAGQAELAERLAADPQARAHRDELARVAAALAELPQLEVPTGAVPSAAVLAWRPRRPKATWARYAGALAAGVVMGAVGLSLYRLSPELGSTPDLQVAGTMAQQADQAVLLDSQAITSPELQGEVALRAVDGLWVVEFDLRSDRPVTVVASYDGDQARLQGLAPDDAAAQIVTGPGRVTFAAEGERHAAFYLKPSAGAAGPVTIRFQAAGRQAVEVSLDPAAR